MNKNHIKKESEDVEEETDEEEVEEYDMNILGIDSNIWCHEILGYLDLVETTKFFHISKTFYIITCLSLKDRNVKTNSILEKIFDQQPSEHFFIKLANWNCFDPGVSGHLLRYCVRMGYFKVLDKLICENPLCSIREWVFDILEKMIQILSNSNDNNENDDLFKSYTGLFIKYAEDIDWEELSSAFAFDILIQNERILEFIKTQIKKHRNVIYAFNYPKLLEESCKEGNHKTMKFLLDHKMDELFKTYEEIWEQAVMSVDHSKAYARGRYEFERSGLGMSYMQYNPSKDQKEVLAVIASKLPLERQIELFRTYYKIHVCSAWLSCIFLRMRGDPLRVFLKSIGNQELNDLFVYFCSLSPIKNYSSVKLMYNINSTYVWMTSVLEFVNSLLLMNKVDEAKDIVIIDPKQKDDICFKKAVLLGNYYLVCALEDYFFDSEEIDDENQELSKKELYLTEKLIFEVICFGLDEKKVKDNPYVFNQVNFGHRVEYNKILRLVIHNNTIRDDVKLIMCRRGIQRMKDLMMVCGNLPQQFLIMKMFLEKQEKIIENRIVF